jgi:multicomponent Na+:H+ antiporter subunit F
MLTETSRLRPKPNEAELKMDKVFLYSGIYLCLSMTLPLYRAVLGPSVPDRMLGANAIGSKTTVLLILIGIIYQRVDMFVDIALAYATLNFIAVLAASRYFQKRKGLYDYRRRPKRSSRGKPIE